MMTLFTLLIVGLAVVAIYFAEKARTFRNRMWKREIEIMAYMQGFNEDYVEHDSGQSRHTLRDLQMIAHPYPLFDVVPVHLLEGLSAWQATELVKDRMSRKEAYIRKEYAGISFSETEDIQRTYLTS